MIDALGVILEEQKNRMCAWVARVQDRFTGKVRQWYFRAEHLRDQDSVVAHINHFHGHVVTIVDISSVKRDPLKRKPLPDVYVSDGTADLALGLSAHEPRKERGLLWPASVEKPATSLLQTTSLTRRPSLLTSASR